MLMPHDELHGTHVSLASAQSPPRAWNLRDPDGGQRNLSHLAETIGPEALRELYKPLSRFMPRCPDPDMALNNFERFLATPQGVQQLPQFLEPRARLLETLLQLLSTSQFFSDLLVDIDAVIPALRGLRAAGHDVTVLHIMDPAEHDLPSSGEALFVDPESALEVPAAVSDVRAAYRKTVDEVIDEWRTMLGALGAGYDLVSTDEPFGVPLRRAFAARQRLP